MAVHTHVFARLCKATALSMGMPRLRQAYVPQPVVDRSAGDLRAYIEGQDPVSKRPFIQEALEGLTAPLEDADLQGPIVARGFVELGFDTKEKLIDWCAGNARLTAREYWDNQWIQYLMRPRAVAGVEPYASRLRAHPDETISIFEPSEIDIVVTGGETQGAWKMIGGVLRAAVSIDAWR